VTYVLRRALCHESAQSVEMMLGGVELDLLLYAVSAALTSPMVPCLTVDTESDDRGCALCSGRFRVGGLVVLVDKKQV
jgi:hypothetical protein